MGQDATRRASISEVDVMKTDRNVTLKNSYYEEKWRKCFR